MEEPKPYRKQDSAQQRAERFIANIVSRNGSPQPPDNITSHPALDAQAKRESLGTAESPEAAAEAVRTGYRVVNEYIDQGLQMARTMQRDMSRKISGGYGFPERGGMNIAATQERWMDMSADLMEMWFAYWGAGSEYWSDMAAMSPFTAARRKRQPPPPATPSPAPEQPRQLSRAATEQVKLAYQIRSAQDAIVYIEFQPGRESTELACMGLRSYEQPDAPEIPVRFEYVRQGEPILVCVSVPDDQPPGRYSSALLDRNSGFPLGNVILTIG